MRRFGKLILLAALALLLASCGGGGGASAPDGVTVVPRGGGQNNGGGNGGGNQQLAVARVSIPLNAKRLRVNASAANFLISILDPVTQQPVAQSITVPVDHTVATQVIDVSVPARDILIVLQSLDANGNVLDIGQGRVNIPAGQTGNLSISLVPFLTGQTGVAGKLVFVTQPVNVNQNAVIPAIQVAIQDANGQTVTSATNTVTLAIANNPAGGSLSGTTTVQAVNGVATFSGLRINNAGVGYTLIAASSNLASATSSSFSVSAVPTSLAFSVQPQNAAQGSAIAPPVQVSILDANGAVVAGATNAVTVALGANPGSDTLSGSLTVNAVNGVATFPNLVLHKPATGYTLLATSPGLTQATSNSFNILAAPGFPFKVVFVTQPTDTASGAPIAPAILVALQDVNGVTVTTATNDVTLSLAPNSVGAALGGTVTVQAVNGVATFSNVFVDKPGSGFRLLASSPGLVGANSNIVNSLGVIGPVVGFVGPRAILPVDQAGNNRGTDTLSVAVADFNRDGRADYVSGDGINTGDPVINMASSPLGSKIPSFVRTAVNGTHSGAFQVAAADINGDGKTDVVYNNGDPSPVQQVAINLNTTPDASLTATFSATSEFDATDSNQNGGYRNLEPVDLNGDGKPDLAFGFGFGRGFSIRLNSSPDDHAFVAFGAPVQFAVGTADGSLSSGDFDGDGKKDLILASGGSNLYAFRNTIANLGTTPTFGNRVVIDVGSISGLAGHVADYAIVADYDGDGKDDFVAVDRIFDRAYLFRSTTAVGNDPTFTFQGSLTTGQTPKFGKAADVNQDGKPDLLVTNFANSSNGNADRNSVSVFLNNSSGAGNLSFRAKVSTETNFNPTTVDAGDFNGDGTKDVVVGTQGGYSTSVFLNSTPSAGTVFTFILPKILTAGNTPSSVEPVDLNHDGSLDLAVTNREGQSVSVFLNAGTPGVASLSGPFNFTVGTQPEQVAVGDFNQDGKPDLVTVNRSSSDVTVLINQTGDGAASPSFVTSSRAVGSQPKRVAVADLNRDGKPDLAVTLSDGVRVFLNTTPDLSTTASFASFDVVTGTSSFSNSIDIVAGDVNNDGVPDLVTEDGFTTYYFYNTTPANGNTFTFTSATRLDFGGVLLALGDVNSDGKLDLAQAGINGGLQVRLAGPNGIDPAGAVTFLEDAGGQVRRVVLKDANGDDIPDLVLTTADDNDVLFKRNTTNNGASTPVFDSGERYVVGDTFQQTPNQVPSGAQQFSWVTVGDLNNDGKDDLVVTSGGSNGLGDVRIIPQK